MKYMMTTVTTLILLGVLAGTMQAVTIETVPVGNTGNLGDTEIMTSGLAGDGTTGYGAVDYDYNIGKYEVTAGQYCEFLNAVAATDTYGLYDTQMTGSNGCQIKQNGSSGSYTYDFSDLPSGTVADWENRPVNFVSWSDATRFANWLHNGQPTGAQDLTTTEDGAYYLNGAITDAALLAINREPDWKWSIPSEDEWYKAAYHKNDGNTGNYFDYPTGSDTAPTAEPPPGTDFVNGSANIYFAVGYLTDAGSYSAKPSDSPYGTFDQGGNLFELNDAIIGSDRGIRGGGYVDSVANMAAFDRNKHGTTNEVFNTGFRVVYIPGPIPGDANRDGYVHVAYLGILATYYGTVSGINWEHGDFNDDDKVNVIDLGILATHYGEGTPPSASVPEPGTITLLLCGLANVALLRRR